MEEVHENQSSERDKSKKYNAYQLIISATFKMCYDFHSAKLLYSGYLSRVLWYKMNLF